MIVSDNGTELTSMAILRWSQESAGRMALHRAGKPQQNAFVESFNGRLRDELLNETLFTSLAHARQALAAWKHDYNTVRPHSAARQSAAGRIRQNQRLPRCNGTRRCATLRAPRPVPLHHRANRAQMKPGLYSSLDETRGSGHGLTSAAIHDSILPNPARPFLSPLFL